MKLTQDQIKGRLKALAAKEGADARMLLRQFLMERFLERLSASEYSEKFVIKGGFLVTALVGVSMRSTMDIDVSIRGWDLNAEEAERIIAEVAGIDIGDGVSFSIKGSQTIMDDFEYPGIRVSLSGMIDKIEVPMKIDISTGDAITPRAIEYNCPLMLEDRKILLWTYNLETMLAEKVQTILARGILNTRMRDYYDVLVLYAVYKDMIDREILRHAFAATCKHRGHLFEHSEISMILERITGDRHLADLWEHYRKKYPYAAEIEYSDVMESIISVTSFIV